MVRFIPFLKVKSSAFLVVQKLEQLVLDVETRPIQGLGGSRVSLEALEPVVSGARWTLIGYHGELTRHPSSVLAEQSSSNLGFWSAPDEGLGRDVTTRCTPGRDNHSSRDLAQ